MMRARHRFFLLLSAVAVAAAAATFFLMRTPPDRRVGPTTTERAIPDSTAVWYASSGGLEFLLRPMIAEADRDDFNRRRWNEYLETTRSPRAFRLLWIVNRGNAPVPHPLGGESSLRVGAIAAEPIDRLLDRPGARIPAFFRKIAEADAVGLRPTIGPGEVARAVVTTPADFELESLENVRLVRAGGDVPFRAGRASLVDLWRFEEAPSGMLHAIVHFGDERVPPGAVSERPRGEKN